MNTRAPASLIELLRVDLLDEFPDLIDPIRHRASELGIQLGWHYDLDLAWIVSQIEDPTGMRILDAGGGTGVLQWWLADHGADIVSVDRLDRADLSGRFRLSYRVSGLRPGDLDPAWKVALRRIGQQDQPTRNRLAWALRACSAGIVGPFIPKSAGHVTLYHHDLESMPELEDDSFDAVVSVSSLEHNDLSVLPHIVEELMRVLRPNGMLLATLSASRNDDWYHEPSKGWCLTEATLRTAFSMPVDTITNFSEYDSILGDLRESRVLRHRLAPMYFESGESGMPWGVWDPQYQPVGVCRQK
ncbi:MAG: class I SAM-dependent methyltransferase [Anaerolineales bacterium]